ADTPPATPPLVQAQDYSGPTNVMGWPDCATVAAGILNMPMTSLYNELDQNRSVAEVAQARGIAPTTVVAAIVASDTKKAHQANPYLANANVRDQTFDIIFNARTFVYTKRPDRGTTPG